MNKHIRFFIDGFVIIKYSETEDETNDAHNKIIQERIIAPRIFSE